jgi:hypothetical protein
MRQKKQPGELERRRLKLHKELRAVCSDMDYATYDLCGTQLDEINDIYRACRKAIDR